MTVIVGMVGKRGVLLAGDSQGSTDWIKREDTSAKVGLLMDTVAYGYCGSGRFGQLLEYHLVDSLDPPPLNMDEYRWVVRDFIPYLRDVTEQHGHLHIKHNVEGFGPSSFLLAVRGRLFCIEDDFSVSEHVMPFESVGSGSETAMGVMHGEFGDVRDPLPDGKLESVAEKAINAATTLTLYVGGEMSSVKTVRFTREEREFMKAQLSGN